MRSPNLKMLLRRLAVLVLATLVMLQLSASIARPIAPCSVGDCDATIQCLVSCTGCVPLPASGASVTTKPIYLAEVLPAVWVDEIPQGALSDIWRPPRKEA